MLHCGYCDYFKVLSVHPGSDKIKASVCEYTNSILLGDVEELDIEYPCNSYCSGQKSKVLISKYDKITA